MHPSLRPLSCTQQSQLANIMASHRASMSVAGSLRTQKTQIWTHPRLALSCLDDAHQPVLLAHSLLCTCDEPN